MTDLQIATATGALETALALHRAGNLDQARAEYERLLAPAPQDANLLGLLGVVAIQQNRPDTAEELLGRALQVANPEPQFHLRNVNNLLVLLIERGRTDAARELAGLELPDWPSNTAPSVSERGTILSLAEVLAMFGQPERALSLLKGVSAYIGGDAEAMSLIGRLRLKCNDAEGALPDLERACEMNPANWQALAAISIAHDALDHTAEASAAAARCARAAPVLIAPKQDGQEASILVLNDPPTRIATADHGLRGLHLTTNIISQVSSRMAKEFRFNSIFAGLHEHVPRLPDTDVVFSNLASGEALSLPGRLDQALELIERIGRPVINHPRAVLQTTRQKVASLLQGVPSLLVPRIERYPLDLAKFDQIEADIAANFTYPVIVRHVAADSSSKSLVSANKTAALVNDANELRRFLERVTWLQFYVVQYVNLRRADGNFRKLRAIFFADEVFIVWGVYHSEWMVGGRLGPAPAFYTAFPHLAVEMKRIVRDPEGMLGSHITPVLEAIRDRVPLDCFGMDFDVDDQGQIVLFEAQSTMIFLTARGVPEYLITPEIDDRVCEAFRRLVRRKIADAA